MHIINSLDVGGAELSLLRLLRASDREDFRPQVISLTDLGPLSASFQDLAMDVSAADLRSAWFNPLRIARLSHQIRSERPAVLQTWTYFSDLIGGILARRQMDGPPVIWSVRQSDLASRVGPLTRLAARACARLSRRIPSRIVFNAESARRVHADAGYDDSRAVVIPNGFDTDIFRPDAQARARLRRELGIAEDVPLVGLIGRFSPVKDHANFVAAAAQVLAANPETRFVLCGHGTTAHNRGIAQLLRWSGTGYAFILLGERHDVAAVNAAIDVAVLASRGEGFPNVVGEAMACATPCVATDVGDVRKLVADTGPVVPPSNPDALAEAILFVLALSPADRKAAGQGARNRIRELFSIRSVAERYQALWDEVAIEGVPT